MKPKQDDTHPYFLWDYNLTEDDVRRILHGENEAERIWMKSRILTHAAYEDVWKYLTLNDIVSEFSKLRMRSQTAQAWRHALTVWGHHV
ncbi:hypothetical protein HY947_01540 [Candidatus Gottesmanbacteria bacterium]|nr:hypothetical protein [Candidatus Gottesmanbacteria bacterium]